MVSKCQPKLYFFLWYHRQFPNASQTWVKKKLFSQDNLLGSEDNVVYEPEGKKPKSLTTYEIIKYSIF